MQMNGVLVKGPRSVVDYHSPSAANYVESRPLQRKGTISVRDAGAGRSPMQVHGSPALPQERQTSSETNKEHQVRTDTADVGDKVRVASEYARHPKFASIRDRIGCLVRRGDFGGWWVRFDGESNDRFCSTGGASGNCYELCKVMPGCYPDMSSGEHAVCCPGANTHKYHDSAVQGKTYEQAHQATRIDATDQTPIAEPSPGTNCWTSSNWGTECEDVELEECCLTECEGDGDAHSLSPHVIPTTTTPPPSPPPPPPRLLTTSELLSEPDSHTQINSQRFIQCRNVTIAGRGHVQEASDHIVTNKRLKVASVVTESPLALKVSANIHSWQSPVAENTRLSPSEAPMAFKVPVGMHKSQSPVEDNTHLSPSEAPMSLKAPVDMRNSQSPVADNTRSSPSEAPMSLKAPVGMHNSQSPVADNSHSLPCTVSVAPPYATRQAADNCMACLKNLFKMEHYEVVLSNLHTENENLRHKDALYKRALSENNQLRHEISSLKEKVLENENKCSQSGQIEQIYHENEQLRNENALYQQALSEMSHEHSISNRREAEARKQDLEEARRNELEMQQRIEHAEQQAAQFQEHMKDTLFLLQQELQRTRTALQQIKNQVEEWKSMANSKVSKESRDHNMIEVVGYKPFAADETFRRSRKGENDRPTFGPAAEEELEKMRAEMTHMHEEMTKMKATKLEVDRRVGAKELEITRLGEELRTRRFTLSRMEAGMQEKVKLIEQLEKEITALQQDLESRNGKIQSLSGECDRMQTESQHLHSQLLDSQKRIEALLEHVDALSRHKNALGEERVRLHELANGNAVQIRELQQARVELQKQLHEQARDAHEARTGHAQLQQALDQAKGRETNLKQDVDSLHRQLQDLRVAMKYFPSSVPPLPAVGHSIPLLQSDASPTRLSLSCKIETLSTTHDAKYALMYGAATHPALPLKQLQIEEILSGTTPKKESLQETPSQRGRNMYDEQSDVGFKPKSKHKNLLPSPPSPPSPPKMREGAETSVDIKAIDTGDNSHQNFMEKLSLGAEDTLAIHQISDSKDDSVNDSGSTNLSRTYRSNAAMHHNETSITDGSRGSEMQAYVMKKVQEQKDMLQQRKQHQQRQFDSIFDSLIRLSQQQVKEQMDTDVGEEEKVRAEGSAKLHVEQNPFEYTLHPNMSEGSVDAIPLLIGPTTREQFESTPCSSSIHTASHCTFRKSLIPNDSDGACSVPPLCSANLEFAAPLHVDGNEQSSPYSYDSIRPGLARRTALRPLAGGLERKEKLTSTCIESDAFCQNILHASGEPKAVDLKSTELHAKGSVPTAGSSITKAAVPSFLEIKMLQDGTDDEVSPLQAEASTHKDEIASQFEKGAPNVELKGRMCLQQQLRMCSTMPETFHFHRMPLDSLDVGAQGADQVDDENNALTHVASIHSDISQEGLASVATRDANTFKAESEFPAQTNSDLYSSAPSSQRPAASTWLKRKIRAPIPFKRNNDGDGASDTRSSRVPAYVEERGAGDVERDASGARARGRLSTWRDSVRLMVGLRV